MNNKRNFYIQNLKMKQDSREKKAGKQSEVDKMYVLVLDFIRYAQ